MNIEIRPITQVDRDHIQEYWQVLYMHSRLDTRLCDVKEPAWGDVVEMIIRMGQQMYMVWDCEKKQYTAEFMLENFTGNAAQIHFSMRPGNRTAYSISLGKYVSEIILGSTPDTPISSPPLDTLFGLTPVTNRAACIFALKAGFKKIGLLPRGIRDRGQVVDAMISIKEAQYGR